MTAAIGGRKNAPKQQPSSKIPDSQKLAVLPASDDPAYFTREDWTQFRDINRIPAMAGVRRELLPKVVAKELADNALDASGGLKKGLLEVNADRIVFFIEDNGPGLDGTDAEIAEHFSIRRPLTSSKLIRRPTRGMLGNGIRVVVGVVLCARGHLRVSTRGRTLTLVPRDDGTTSVQSSEPWDGKGTRIEVTLTGDLARDAADTDGDLFGWVQEADALNCGRMYKGKSSPHWYDPAAFWEVCQASGPMPVERFVGKYLDGCSDRDKVTTVAGSLMGRKCNTLSRDEAARILRRATGVAKPVTAERLGKVGRRDDYFGYGIETGEFNRDGAVVPFVVEAWANRDDHPGVVIAINRTPAVTSFRLVRRDGNYYVLVGGELAHYVTATQKRAGDFRLLVNIITPSVPLTSSGKDPDLTAMADEIVNACEAAIRGARKNQPRANGQKVTQKSFILQRLDAAAESLSGGRTCLFSLRQLYYWIRPFLIPLLGREPNYGTFARIIGEYEDKHGDIEGLYRDDRGVLYHPHTGETIQLGTRSVADYQRPEWLFNKVLYCEKEGLFPMLIQARWPERYDIAICTSKGYATRAARSLLRRMKTGEPVACFVAHDADGPGTCIFDVMERQLRPHGVEVINLGLDPAEGREMGLQAEPVTPRKGKGGRTKRIAVGRYVPQADSEWLQSRRIELNAMTTPQFLDWLTSKVEHHVRELRITSKVIPGPLVIDERFRAEVRTALTRRLEEEAIRNANIEGQVDAILRQRAGELTKVAGTLSARLNQHLKADPTKHWSGIVKDTAVTVSAKAGKTGRK